MKKMNLFLLSLFIALFATSCSTMPPGFAPGSQAITVLDQNGDPVSGATVWLFITPPGVALVAGSSQPHDDEFIGLTDRGITCEDPTTSYTSAGCTDPEGMVFLNCAGTVDQTVVVLFDGVEYDASTNCEGEATEIEIDIEEPTPTPTPTPA